MTLGFYYHIVVYSDKQGRIFVPAYLGLFVDELAKNAEQLLYFAYTSTKITNEQNYELKQNNIILVNLGLKKPFPITVAFGHYFLRKFKKEASLCNAILVRAPSPLAPYFYSRFRKLTKISYLMVGDYMEGIKHQNFNLIKQRLINLFTHINEYFQNKAIRNSGCIVNSIPLKIKYEKLNTKVAIVKTTTLTKDDFYERNNTCSDPGNIKLLFVGRIEKAKGMDELLAAFTLLREKSYLVSLHLAGWDTNDAKKYFQLLNENSLTANSWHYHGMLGIKDLFKLYQSSDIFVLPSHHEGFPRVIWEAMANSLPVIATNVGSIPFYLKNKHNAILIEPKNKNALYASIIELINNNELRKNNIENAFSLVQENTLDKHIKMLINNLG